MKTNDTAPRITHRTVNTGDVQRFSLTDSNFNPAVIAKMKDMLTVPVMDYSIVMKEEPEGFSFYVLGGPRPLSKNDVRRDTEGNIELSTLMLPASLNLSPDELQMLADLEQCAAIGLLPVGTVQ